MTKTCNGTCKSSQTSHQCTGRLCTWHSASCSCACSPPFCSNLAALPPSWADGHCHCSAHSCSLNSQKEDQSGHHCCLQAGHWPQLLVPGKNPSQEQVQQCGAAAAIHPVHPWWGPPAHLSWSRPVWAWAGWSAEAWSRRWAKPSQQSGRRGAYTTSCPSSSSCRWTPSCCTCQLHPCCSCTHWWCWGRGWWHTFSAFYTTAAAWWWAPHCGSWRRCWPACCHTNHRQPLHHLTWSRRPLFFLPQLLLALQKPTNLSVLLDCPICGNVHLPKPLYQQGWGELVVKIQLASWRQALSQLQNHKPWLTYVSQAQWQRCALEGCRQQSEICRRNLSGQPVPTPCTPTWSACSWYNFSGCGFAWTGPSVHQHTDEGRSTQILWSGWSWDQAQPWSCTGGWNLDFRKQAAAHYLKSAEGGGSSETCHVSWCQQWQQSCGLEPSTFSCLAGGKQTCKGRSLRTA